jgi:hypothetical protein
MLKSFLSCLVMLRDHGGSSVSKSTVSCANLIHLDLNPRGVPTGAMKSDPHIVAHQAEGNVRKQCGAFMSLLNLHQSLVVCRMIRVILCSDNRQKDVDSQSTCINRCAISMTRHDQAFFQRNWGLRSQWQATVLHESLLGGGHQQSETNQHGNLGSNMVE